MYIYIYIYIYVCVCVCVCLLPLLKSEDKSSVCLSLHNLFYKGMRCMEQWLVERGLVPYLAPVYCGSISKRCLCSGLTKFTQERN